MTKNRLARKIVALEVDLAQPLEPGQEENLRRALQGIDGKALDSSVAAPEKISLCYDPTRTSRKQLLQPISAGWRKIETGRERHLTAGSAAETKGRAGVAGKLEPA